MFRAALIYFCVMFAIGFLLGVLRTLWLIPQIGIRTAELMEACLLLVAIYITALWVSRRLCKNFASVSKIGVGLIAAGLVLIADMGVGVVLRGMSPQDVFTHRDLVSNLVYFGLLAFFALAPWLLTRKAA